MINYLLKPFLGLLTVGGLGTGSYFLYKYSTSKKNKESQEENSIQTPASNTARTQPTNTQGDVSVPSGTFTPEISDGSSVNLGGGTSQSPQ